MQNKDKAALVLATATAFTGGSYFADGEIQEITKEVEIVKEVEVVKEVRFEELHHNGDSALVAFIGLPESTTNQEIGEGWKAKDQIIDKQKNIIDSQAEKIKELQSLNAEAAKVIKKKTASERLRELRGQ